MMNSKTVLSGAQQVARGTLSAGSVARKQEER